MHVRALPHVFASCLLTPAAEIVQVEEMRACTAVLQGAVMDVLVQSLHDVTLGALPLAPLAAEAEPETAMAALRWLWASIHGP